MSDDGASTRLGEIVSDTINDRVRFKRGIFFFFTVRATSQSFDYTITVKNWWGRDRDPGPDDMNSVARHAARRA